MEGNLKQILSLREFNEAVISDFRLSYPKKKSIKTPW